MKEIYELSLIPGASEQRSRRLFEPIYDGPIKKNSQSSNTATIPNFVPTLSQFMYQEASSGFGQQEATNGGESSWAGSSVSASISTPAGGYSFEGGYILSKNGKKGTQFITHGSSYGLQISASYNFIYINNMKNLDDFKGKGIVAEFNYLLGSLSIFGNTSPNYPENNVFTNYWGFEIGIGPSFGRKSGGYSPSTTTSFVNWIPDISVKEFWWGYR